MARRDPALLLLVLLALLGAPAPAAAGADEVERAKRYFEGGKDAYEAGQYLAAIAAFEEVLRLAPRPPVLFTLAQACRLQYVVDKDPARLERAVQLYRQYLEEVPRGGRRDHAVRHLAAMEPLLGRGSTARAVSSGPRKTQLMIYSRSRGARAAVGAAAAAPVPLVLEVAPGVHRVKVEAEGYFPDELDGTAIEGQLTVLEVPLREKPARLAVAAPDGARVFVDGRPVAELPVAAPIELAAGDHAITIVEKGAHPFVRTLRLGRGEEQAITAQLETTGQRVAASWLLAGGAAFALSGLTTSGIALSAESDALAIETRRDGGERLAAEDVNRFNDLVADRDTFRSVSWGLYGGAALLSAVGGVLWLSDAAHEVIAPAPIPLPPAPAPAVTPTESESGESSVEASAAE